MLSIPLFCYFWQLHSPPPYEISHVQSLFKGYKNKILSDILLLTPKLKSCYGFTFYKCKFYSNGDDFTFINMSSIRSIPLITLLRKNIKN